MTLDPPSSKSPMSALPPTAAETQASYMKRPKIALVVHYQYYGGPCTAAIITKVYEDNSVALDLFYPPNAYVIARRSLTRVKQTPGPVDSYEEKPKWHSTENCYF